MCAFKKGTHYNRISWLSCNRFLHRINQLQATIWLPLSYIFCNRLRVLTKVSFLFPLFFDCSVTSLQCSKVATVTLLRNQLPDFCRIIVVMTYICSRYPLHAAGCYLCLSSLSKNRVISSSAPIIMSVILYAYVVKCCKLVSK